MAAAPILRCRDIHRAERFYREVLGAVLNWSWGEGNPGYRSVTVFGAELHLSSFAGDGAFGTAVYIRIDDVDAVAARLGAVAPDCIEHGPADQPWGQRELYLRDPDNNQVRLGARSADRALSAARRHPDAAAGEHEPRWHGDAPDASGPGGGSPPRDRR